MDDGYSCAHLSCLHSGVWGKGSLSSTEMFYAKNLGRNNNDVSSLTPEVPAAFKISQALRVNPGFSGEILMLSLQMVMQ